MNDILQGLLQAARLVVTLDADLFEITLLSLQVGMTATVVALAISLPLGAWLAVSRAPEVLLLDEPCSNLDGRATRDIEAAPHRAFFESPLSAELRAYLNGDLLS